VLPESQYLARASMPFMQHAADFCRCDKQVCQLVNGIDSHSSHSSNLSQNIALDWYTCVFIAGIVSLIIALQHQKDGGLLCRQSRSLLHARPTG
jgi:hypothetical protein